jgi:hypothetical protein
VQELVPNVDSDDEGELRASLAERIRLVSGFIRPLCEVIQFGANAEGAAVLAEMRRMPQLLAARKLKAADIDGTRVHGSWRRLVYGQPAPADGAVDKNAYAFCVLTQFHRHLNRRDIYAPASSRWRDPRALLLDGDGWANAKQPVLSAPSLPENPDRLLAEHACVLDGAYREVAGRLRDSSVTVDAQGRLHLGALEAAEEPALIELRQLIRAMLPRVSVPAVILEVMAWEPRFVEAFTAVSGGRSRLKDLEVTIAACLTAHALNIGFVPITKQGVPALERDRLSHVDQNYMRAETYAAANPWLV